MRGNRPSAGIVALLGLLTSGAWLHAGAVTPPVTSPGAGPGPAEPPRVVAPPANRFAPPPPEHGSWTWLLDRSGSANLVVDPEAWQRLLGPAARDPVERPVLAELLDGYRRRMVEALDRFESTVAPGIDRAQRREWYLEHRGQDPRLTQPSANAHRALRREELAALETLAADTVDAALGRAAFADGFATLLVLGDGGEPPSSVTAPPQGGESGAENRARLVARVRDELIIAARLMHFRDMAISGIAGVGEKHDVLREIDAFLDRHETLVRPATPTAPGDDARVPVSLDAILPHLSPHRADLARHHLAWRDAFANITRSTFDASVDTAREWRTIRRSMLEIGLLNDRLAHEVATALRMLCADGETAARMWLREWRIRASDESVPVADAFETAIAWIEATDAVATDAARAALREMRREHEARRAARDEAIMRARFDRLRCTSRSDDPGECPRDGIVAAEASLEEAAQRRVVDLRGLITSPELADLFERRFVRTDGRR